MDYGKLYIVATPIGNLKDITLRAIEILKEVDYIVSEDTRNTGNLVNLLIGKENIKASYISYFEHNEEPKIAEIVSNLMLGKNMALVSDSGTPLISDPGFKLVRECINNKIEVIPIPGPSSVLSSLVMSGLPTDKFTFLGFLPKKEGNRLKLLSSLKESLVHLSSTVILFESPYRLIKTLMELQETFGDINITICREITKIHESIIKDNIKQVINDLGSKSIKGEVVLLFNLKDN